MDGNVVRRVVVTLDATMNTATVLTRSQAVQVAQAILATRYSFADIRDRDRARLAHPAHKETSPGTPIAVGTIGKNPVRPVLPRLHYPQGIEYKGRHEPLISEKLYEKVQNVLATTGHSGIRHRVHHHLKGLLWCGRCKKRFILANNTGNGGTYPYMSCMGRMKHICDMPYLRLDGRNGIEQAISNHYGTVTLNKTTRVTLTAEVDQAIATEQALSEHVRSQLVRNSPSSKIENSKSSQSPRPTHRCPHHLQPGTDEGRPCAPKQSSASSTSTPTQTGPSPSPRRS